MFGAIAGDVIGSPYEWNPIKTKEFPLFSNYSIFTDDTVLTVAVAVAILYNQPYDKILREFSLRYSNRPYGGHFRQWVEDQNMGPYNSWGNGSAMRVSPVGFAAVSEEWALSEAKKSAEVTHNHPEGIKGAQATALAIFLGKNGKSKEEIRSRIESTFNYNLSRTLDEIRPTYTFEISCQKTVPEAIIAFLESDNFEGAIRNAISLGGDSDTLACITGGIAQAYYRVIPNFIIKEVENRLPVEFLNIIKEFELRFTEE
jgi:ADP-ribosylglycohydrolase